MKIMRKKNDTPLSIISTNNGILYHMRKTSVIGHLTSNNQYFLDLIKFKTKSC